MSFKRATRKNAKLRLALDGVSGAGKSMTGLLLLKEFAKKPGAIDSEKGSLSLYADLFPFDVVELEDATIQDYLAAIKDAAEQGYDGLLIDSYSHSWMAALEAVDRSGGWGKGGKSVSPLLKRLVKAILSYPGHVICTFRSEMKHTPETNDAGKIVGMKKLGVGPVARKDTEYEFSIWLSLEREGGITVSKTRCSALEGQIYNRETDVPKIAATIKEWLGVGAVESKADQLAERIRFCQTQEDLDALTTKMKTALAEGKLSKADIAAVREVYEAQKKEIAASEEVAA